MRHIAFFKKYYFALPDAIIELHCVLRFYLLKFCSPLSYLLVAAPRFTAAVTDKSISILTKSARADK